MPVGMPHMPSFTASSKSNPSKAELSGFGQERTHSSGVLLHKCPRPTRSASMVIISQSDLLSPSGSMAGFTRNTQGARSYRSQYSHKLVAGST